MANVDEAITEMLTTYHELNGNIDELLEAPSPLEFMRFVSKNRPFTIRNGCRDWPALQNWNLSYLKAKMYNKPVKVAITPHGSVVFRMSEHLAHLLCMLSLLKEMPIQRPAIRRLALRISSSRLKQ